MSQSDKCMKKKSYFLKIMQKLFSSIHHIIKKSYIKYLRKQNFPVNSMKFIFQGQSGDRWTGRQGHQHIHDQKHKLNKEKKLERSQKSSQKCTKKNRVVNR